MITQNIKQNRHALPHHRFFGYSHQLIRYINNAYKLDVIRLRASNTFAPPPGGIFEAMVFLKAA